MDPALRHGGVSQRPDLPLLGRALLGFLVANEAACRVPASKHSDCEHVGDLLETVGGILSPYNAPSTCLRDALRTQLGYDMPTEVDAFTHLGRLAQAMRELYVMYRPAIDDPEDPEWRPHIVFQRFAGLFGCKLPRQRDAAEVAPNNSCQLCWWLKDTVVVQDPTQQPRAPGATPTEPLHTETVVEPAALPESPEPVSHAARASRALQAVSLTDTSDPDDEPPAMVTRHDPSDRPDPQGDGDRDAAAQETPAEPDGDGQSESSDLRIPANTNANVAPAVRRECK